MKGERIHECVRLWPGGTGSQGKSGNELCSGASSYTLPVPARGASYLGLSHASSSKVSTGMVSVPSSLEG